MLAHRARPLSSQSPVPLHRTSYSHSGNARTASGVGIALRAVLVVLVLLMGLGGRSGAGGPWGVSASQAHASHSSGDDHPGVLQAVVPTAPVQGHAQPQHLPLPAVCKDHGPGHALHLRAGQRALHTAWVRMVRCERIVRITLRRCSLLYPFHVFW